MKTITLSAALRCLCSVPAVMLYLAGQAHAQLSIGVVEGAIHGWNREQPESLRVVLQEASTGSSVGEAVPSGSGTFTFRNVPFAAYSLLLMHRGTVLIRQPVDVRSAVPITADLDTVREYRLGEVTVEGTVPPPLAVSTMTTHSFYSHESIAQLPVVDQSKSIEAILLNTPGVVPDEDGRLHVRGEDAQLQYVVDGIPITGNLTRVYSSLFNAALIKSADVQTGALSAEYGIATSGIVAVTTRSGFDRPLFVHTAGTAGSYRSRGGLVEAGGNIDDRSALYVAASASGSDRYLDPISGASPIHDDGNARSFFGKVNTLVGDDVDLTALGMYNRTKFSVPNQFARTPAQDQRQELDDYLIGGRLNFQLGPSSVLSVLGYTRRSQATVTSGGLRRIASAADSLKALTENEKFFVGGDRKYTTTGGQLEFSARTDWFDLPNSFKAGVAGDAMPVSEFFTFAVTNPSIADTGMEGGDDRYVPYDLTRGGSPFLVDRSVTGNRFSGYLQDEILYDRWAFNVGVRFDAFKLIESENAISPRVAAAYALNDDLVLRASYNRIVMQAPVENYLVSSSSEAQALVGSEQGAVPISVRSEKANVFEIGGAYRAAPYLDFDLSGYLKLIDDFIVKVELGNSGVIFPVNLKQGLVAGGDLRVRLRDWNNLTGFLSVGTCISRGLVPEDGSTPFAAGLVLGEEGESYSNPFKGEDSFPTEHNQIITASFVVTYAHPSGAFGTLGGRFDSGLPFDLTGPGGAALNEEQSRQELIDRGYSAEVIDLLELKPETEGSPDRSVAPHATFDAAVGYDFTRVMQFPLKLTVSCLNIFDTLYLYKFESTFGGTHFGVPRTVAARIDLAY